MRKLLVISVLFLSVIGGLSAQILDKTIATVTLHKTENVSMTKLDEQLEIWKKQTNQEITQEIRKTVLTATINDMLISQAAEKEGIVATNQQINEYINQFIEQQKVALGTPISDDDIKKLIENETGIPWAEYREQFKTRIIQEQFIYKKYSDQLKNAPEPTEKEIEEVYDLYSDRFVNPKMIRVSHLFWETNGTSNSAERAVKQKADTANQAINKQANEFDKYEKKALDDPSFEAGDLGYIIRDQGTYRILGQSFIDSIFTLEEDEVSRVIQSNLGYHIVKITDKRNARLLGLKDPIYPGEKITVRDRVVALLAEQKQQEHFLNLVKEEVDYLRESARIKIIDKNYQ